jgi:hypothetical protein
VTPDITAVFGRPGMVGVPVGMVPLELQKAFWLDDWGVGQ